MPPLEFRDVVAQRESVCVSRGSVNRAAPTGRPIGHQVPVRVWFGYPGAVSNTVHVYVTLLLFFL